MKLLKIIPVILLFIFVSACGEDDFVKPQDSPGLQRGDIEANRMIITFQPRSGGGAAQSFEFYDKDGLGGNDPEINESWTLRYPSSGSTRNYSAVTRFYLDDVDVTERIEAKGENYIVCYRQGNTLNLRVQDTNLDKNGLKLGTTSNWQTLDDTGNGGNGSGTLKVTLNYLHLRKEGICDAGVRIFEASIPYQHQ